MTHESESSTYQTEGGNKAKGVFLQIGIYALAIVVLFLIMGVVVRAALGA